MEEEEEEENRNLESKQKAIPAWLVRKARSGRHPGNSCKGTEQFQLEGAT